MIGARKSDAHISQEYKINYEITDNPAHLSLALQEGKTVGQDDRRVEDNEQHDEIPGDFEATMGVEHFQPLASTARLRPVDVLFLFLQE